MLLLLPQRRGPLLLSLKNIHDLFFNARYEEEQKNQEEQYYNLMV
jgi:hypothetical protein